MQTTILLLLLFFFDFTWYFNANLVGLEIFYTIHESNTNLADLVSYLVKCSISCGLCR
jgi:hypothetical protein